ncbi:insulin receptor substrate 1 isoform X2 [Coccinella septempunctata]|uniref:insulin receptor substrate 1 isoform X2 n=1 Tax=Coccinella septempunctata TaxID=41139 RepID=UPI001D064E45|nr:insulin receptor substrate 1 isoform X2 [Coccinella septempunctata]
MSTSGSAYPEEGFNILRTGYMKKIKTGRRKWFVLRKETQEAQARLEYYDSEKKYQSGVAPRKSIIMKTCFNINQLSDPKHKHVIALYTKDECLKLAIDDKQEADEWFKDLLLMQQGEDLPEGQIPRPTFAHVWEVLLVNRGLGTQDLIGTYRLCLREKTLTLVKKDHDFQIEINLSSIRSCGSLQKYVYFEVGRSCPLGAGELWMETEDQYIAQNVHLTVYHTMTSNGKEELGPKSRFRSSSATETSKPNVDKKYNSKSHLFPQDHTQNVDSCLCGVQSHNIQNPIGGVAFSGSINHQRTQSLPLATPATALEHPHQQHSRTSKRSNQSKCVSSGGRERCDSMPSRARTTSEGNHPVPMFPRSHLAPHRPCSMHRDLGCSPPIGSPISPPSAGASTDSAGSSYSLIDENEDLDSNHGRYGHSLTPDEVIAEEDCDSLCAHYGISPNTGNYLPMAAPSSDDGYVAMSPLGAHSNITPAASLSSVTSGTPSTDMRFAEYPLDKVVSFFPPSSDDESRPIRAYSVGSRPETYKYKKHLMDIHGTAESRRDRAASVGSKTKKGPVRVLPPHGHYPQAHPKSSSAPLLSSSRIPGSTSSVGSEMDDFLEMDFTNIKKKSSKDGYLEMKPSPKSSAVSTPATTPSGYVEMKPGVTPPNISNSGPYLEMKPGTPPNRANEYAFMDSNRAYINRTDLPRNDYMDMNAKNTSKKPTLTNNNYAYVNYLDHNDVNHHQPTIRRSYSQLSPSTGNCFRNMGSPNSDYLDMNSKNRVRSDSDQSNEGYVEMSLGRGHHRQSSLDSAQLNREDHSGMSAGSVLKKKELKPNKKENNRSLPIQILNANQNNPINGRIYCDGSPKMQLHLTNTTTSPVSSLPRGRKNSTRRDSRDSSSSSVTTPSNSSTIFPLSLNSPSSPVKPLKTPEKSTPSLINSLYKRFRGKSNESQDDASVSDCQKNAAKVSAKSNDYMNLDLSKSNDYAEMQPGLHTVPDVNKAFSMMTLSETSSRVFKPISESRECGTSPPPSTNALPANSPTNDYPKTEEAEVKSDTKCTTDGSNDPSASKPVSRPGSASSDLCSSTSTLVGSRPDSVNSDSIRPPSALHYANLDLQTIDDDGSKSPRTARNNSNDSGQEVSFTYAEIDFNKSEGLKKGVKH